MCTLNACIGSELDQLFIQQNNKESYKIIPTFI